MSKNNQKIIKKIRPEIIIPSILPDISLPPHAIRRTKPDSTATKNISLPPFLERRAWTDKKIKNLALWEVCPAPSIARADDNNDPSQCGNTRYCQKRGPHCRIFLPLARLSPSFFLSFLFIFFHFHPVMFCYSRVILLPALLTVFSLFFPFRFSFGGGGGRRLVRQGGKAGRQATVYSITTPED